MIGDEMSVAFEKAVDNFKKDFPGDWTKYMNEILNNPNYKEILLSMFIQGSNYELSKAIETQEELKIKKGIVDKNPIYNC